MMTSNTLNDLFNILRDNEGLTGDKALRCVSSFIALKLLDSRFGNDIDLSNFDGYSTVAEEQGVLPYYFEYAHLSKFMAKASKDKDWDAIGVFRDVWTEVLAVHPAIRDYFPPARLNDIKNDRTIKLMLDRIMGINLGSSDLLGDIYESKIGDTMTGRDLGQFFTPSPLKKIMVELIKPQVGESIYDPAMGTGGLLITAFEYMKQQSVNGTTLSRHLIDDTFGGREIEPDTYQLAATNMLIRMGFVPKDVLRGDSIREPTVKEYDVVLANPPFGIKGLDYKSVVVKGRDKQEYLPHKSNKATLLFLQAIIATLKHGGRCALVFPAGEELFGKSSQRIREHLLDSCDLRQVVSMDGGLFTNTSVRTVILYFIKGSPTKEVWFRGHEGEGFTIDIEKIRAKDCSLFAAHYVDNGSSIVEDDNATIQLARLGHVATMQRGTQLSKCKAINGPYPVIGGGKEPTCYHNDYNRQANTILCSSSGTSGHISMYSTPVWASDCFSIVPNPDLVDNRYLYYLLKSKQEELYSLRSGLGPSHVYPKDLEQIDIPVPPMEQQMRLVQTMDEVEALISSLNQQTDKYDRLIQLRSDAVRNLAARASSYCNLGQVVTIRRGTSLSKADATHGPYPVIGGGKSPKFYHNAYNREANTILCSSTGTAGYISRYCTPVWATACFSIHPNESVDNDYLYHYLKSIQDVIYTFQKGAAQPTVSAEDLAGIEIPIPPLEEQKRLALVFKEVGPDAETDFLNIVNNRIACLRQLQNTILHTSLSGPVKRVRLTQPNRQVSPSRSSSSGSGESPKVKNPKTNKLINVNGQAFNKLIKEGYTYNGQTNELTIAGSPYLRGVPTPQVPTPQVTDKVRNPKTNRQIAIGGKAYNALLAEGYVYDEATKQLIR